MALPLPLSAIESLTIQPLANEHSAAILTFLDERPTNTVIMSGLIRDNSLVSQLNRGTFYACYDERGHVKGVALVGHLTLFETRTDAAIAAFARTTQNCPRTRILLGEKEKLELFWQHYATGGQTPRVISDELLFEMRRPPQAYQLVDGLRQATTDDIELLLPTIAGMVFEESGIHPMNVDPVGFCQRLTRRVEQGRVWVWMKRGELLFSAMIVADTPRAIYLEGIYVSPAHRGKGYGLRCMSQLNQRLLMSTQAICGFVNQQNTAAVPFYQKAGYDFCTPYSKIYL